MRVVIELPGVSVDKIRLKIVKWSRQLSLLIVAGDSTPNYPELFHEDEQFGLLADEGRTVGPFSCFIMIEGTARVSHEFLFF